MSAPSAPIPAPITSWIGIDGVALVIGAGQGIGKTTALSFASAGASAIVLSGRTVSTLTQTAEEIKQLNLPHPVETLVVTADITNEEQVKNLFAIAQGKFGRIDYVANTAGLLGHAPGPIADLDIQKIKDQLATNAVGFLIVLRVAIKSLLLQEPHSVPGISSLSHPPVRGSIVMLGSAATHQTIPQAAGYTMGKYAALGMMKTAALDYARQGIRINEVAPGWTMTPGVTSGENNMEGVADMVAGTTPIGRWATPEEAADVVVFMSSPRASYAIGESWVVGGGVSVKPTWIQ